MHLNRKWIVCALCAAAAALSARAETFTLSSDKVRVSVDDRGRLTELRNLKTGTDYAGGGTLWRLYFDTPGQREIQVDGARLRPEVSSDGTSIVLRYATMREEPRLGRELSFALKLTLSLEGGLVRFGAELANSEPHTIIRELQYPLVGNLQLPESFQLMTTVGGGQLHSDVKSLIAREGIKAPYMTPAQHYRQMTVEYPKGAVAANCFALLGESEGLYFGSHDASLVNTGHGLRVYPSAPGVFDRLECGFYKYPNCPCGGSWKCDANVVSPYTGDWTVTSKIYRAWVDASWWDRHTPPQWVRKMKSWQRVVFKHQYGEYFFRYKDIPGRILDVEKSVGSDALLVFGWWEEGMDHGNPDYVPDGSQGGAEGLKAALKEYEAAGGHSVLYFNGKLIDRESGFYRNGLAEGLTVKDNTGTETVENYKFTAMGSFLGQYNFRSFAVADTRAPRWRQLMKSWVDMTHELGASSIFYDQMGAVDRSSPQWDRSGEFPVPDLASLTAKGGAMKLCRDYAHSRYPGMAIGSEHITDYLSMYVDFTHGDGLLDFIDWFRYTFPELILSDRRIRDDNDIERRVNLTLLKGLRNDIEIYRCRGLIDETPVYQTYLARVNAVKERYSDLLLEGRFAYKDFFSSSNPSVEARCFEADKRLAVVVTSEERSKQKTRIFVPGYHYVECSTLGDARVCPKGRNVTLGRHGLAVLIFEKL